MEFIYSNEYDAYQDILDKKVVDCLSKHVMRMESDKAKQLYECSRKIGVPQIIWGYGDGLHKDIEMNRIIQIGCIQHLMGHKEVKPLRVVIDTNGIPWVDNLHTVVRTILLHGEDITIADCNPYIADMSKSMPKVVSVKGSMHSDVKVISGAIRAATRRMNRIHSDMYKINYTIKDFMEENEINKDALTISSSRLYGYNNENYDTESVI